MKPLAIVGAALLLVASVQPSSAQWIQNPLTTPLAPNCPAGYSWTKNGVRYQCETPQPSCTYGFASGPVWTGSAWSYSCNSPPPPPPPVTNPNQPSGGQTPPDPVTVSLNVCITAAAQNGITLGPITRQYSFNSHAGPALQTYHDTSTGPQWQDPISGVTSNSYWVTCNTLVSTGQFVPVADNPYLWAPNYSYSSGGGGGN
jgi:hypothetical protein